MVRGRKKVLDVLEFNSSTVRFCRSASRGSERVITDCFAFPLEGDTATLLKLIRQQWKVRRMNPENIILAVPRSHVLSKFLRLPSSDSDEIRDMVSLHISRETAAAGPKQIVTSFDIVGFDEKGYALVSVFSLSLEHLEAYLDILKKLHIYPERVTLNTQGLLNWSLVQEIASGDAAEGAYLLNMDDRCFDFNVFFNGHVFFSRTFKFSPETTDAFGLWLAKEVKVSIELFKRMYGDLFPLPDTITTTGFSSHFKPSDALCLVPYKTVNVVATANMLMRPSVRKFLEKEELSYASVLGLALREEGLDMTPQEMKTFLRERRREALLRKVSLLASACFFLLCVFLGQSVHSKIRVLEFLSEEERALAPWFREAERVEENYDLESRMTGISRWQETFARLYTVTGPSIFLTHLSISSEGLRVLQGSGTDYAAVFDYFKRLKGDPVFLKARLAYVQEDKMGEKNVSFRIISE